MTNPLNGRDYITRLVLKVNGETFENMHYGFEGSAGLILWYRNFVEQYGQRNVELVSNERYVPVSHVGLSYQAATAIMGAIGALKHAFDNIEAQIITPEQAKLNLLIESYKVEPTEDEIEVELATFLGGPEHPWYSDIKGALMVRK